MLTRRFLIGSMLAAPVIIKTPGLLMPIKALKPALIWDCNVTLVANQKWLQENLAKTLLSALTDHGPVYYNPAGKLLTKEMASRVADAVITVNRRA